MRRRELHPLRSASLGGVKLTKAPFYSRHPPNCLLTPAYNTHTLPAFPHPLVYPPAAPPTTPAFLSCPSAPTGPDQTDQTQTQTRPGVLEGFLGVLGALGSVLEGSWRFLEGSCIDPYMILVNVPCETTVKFALN